MCYFVSSATSNGLTSCLLSYVCLLTFLVVVDTAADLDASIAEHSLRISSTKDDVVLLHHRSSDVQDQIARHKQEIAANRAEIDVCLSLRDFVVIAVIIYTPLSCVSLFFTCYRE